MLAATLSPSYGIYSGFEHFENVPVQEGSEEYLDSEKYEAKARKLDGPLLPMVRRLNEIRRAEPALQRVDNLRWLDAEHEHLVAYVKGDVVVIVNVDPVRRARGRRERPGGARLAADVLRVRSARRRALPLDDRPQLRPPRPGPGTRLQGRDACVSARGLTEAPRAVPETRPGQVPDCPTRQPARVPDTRRRRLSLGHGRAEATGSSGTRSGSRPRSSTRSTSAGSSTGTTTAPATSAG